VLDAIDECGAPMVSIAGGEPLLHKEIGRDRRAIMARKKFVILCTNALLLEKKIDQYKPSPYLFTWSIHLDGDKEMHDKSVCQDGVFDRAVEAIKAGQGQGLPRQRSTAPLRRTPPSAIAAFFDFMTAGRRRHHRVARLCL
jgi:MoaA/NifB/PqqE/SkfB family radical SAM enzyme